MEKKKILLICILMLIPIVIAADSQIMIFDHPRTTSIPHIFSLTTYDAEPARVSESNMHGGLLELATGQTINAAANFSVNQGIGKMFFVIDTATDSVGTVYVRGTKIDRETGAMTSNYIDSLTINGLSSDDSTTDGNGNPVHNFTDVYITNVWFTGAVTFYTTDVSATDVDVYHISFEQFNDKDETVVNTIDSNLLATNINAEFDAYIYKLIKNGGGKVDISSFASLHLGTNGVAPIADRYYRLRKGDINQSINGTKDGIWVDVHYSNSPAYVEDMTFKIWGTQEN